jgi:thiol-disulfide isomerase/thioredoxin
LIGKGTFQIPEIKAKVVIIEIFSMYCPYCQREAPEVNKLYRAVEGDPNLRGKIKLIGIGAGNSQFEVGVFRKTYKVPFPLFPDEDFSLHKCFGETRTPYFIAIQIYENGTHKVIYSKLGGIEGAEKFLKQITQLSGLGAEAK